MTKSRGRRDGPSGPKITIPPDEKKWLRGRRKELKWSQELMAAKLGTTHATISNMETGRSGQTYAVVYAEAKRLLLRGEKEPSDDAAESRYMRIINRIAQADARTLAAIEAIIDSQIESTG